MAQDPLLDDDSHLVRSKAELEALRSPARQELLYALERHGAQTVRQLAERLGRSAESLYYHLDKLVKAKLVVSSERKPEGGRPERVFEQAAARIVLDPERRSKGFLEGVGRIYGAALRHAERGLERALVRDRKRPADEPRTSGLVVFPSRLTPEGITRLRGKLAELEAFLADEDDPEGAPVTVTVAFHSDA